MFDIGFFELIVVLLVAFVVLTPSDFARILHKIGKLMRFFKNTQKDLKKSYKPLMDEMELKDVTKDAQRKAAKKEPLTHMPGHDAQD